MSRGDGRRSDADLDDAAVDDTEDLVSELDTVPEDLEQDLEQDLVDEDAAGEEGGAGGKGAKGARARAPRAPRRAGPFRRLYRGETSFDFVGRRKLWVIISLVVIVAGILSLSVRGLNLGITFKGGEAWTVRAPGVTQVQALDTVQHAGLNEPTVQLLGTGGAQQVRVTADLNSLGTSARTAQEHKVVDALANLAHTAPENVTVTTVGPTWGGEVTKKAVIALIVFLVLVAVYISIRFEPKMAVAAFVALLHDLLVTAGVYSLFGFQVTPDTVIAVLTILGYSLYDTVVVFDRVRDNTKGLGASGRMTYSEMVNLSMNQTLARSVNTSLVAILPVLSILVIGAELLGATTLLTYGLALFVGLVSGAYSSIFIASPILAWLKEREPRYVAMRQRIEAKGERLGLLTPTAAAALVGSSAGGAAGSRAAGRPSGAKGALRPGQAGRARQPAPAARAEAAAVGAPAPDAQGKTAAKTAAKAPATTPSKNGATSAARRPSSGGGRPGGARRPPQRSRKGGKGKRRR